MNKKTLILTTLITLLAISVSAQKRLAAYSVGFYNVENLFDTEYDATINDEDFTPQGAYTWTQPQYQRKLENIAFVIDKLGKEYVPAGPALLGISEVENRKVLEDLVATAPIANKGYKIVHYDSPDRRGIDVAMLYDPAQFTLKSAKTYKYILPPEMYIYPGDSAFTTRDQLLVSGTLAGESTHVIVGHWPSRWGGAVSGSRREHAAAISKHISDSIYNADANANIIIMGDFNDDPTDSSLRKVLNAKRNQHEVEKGGLFNTMWEFYDLGIGSLGYKGQWNLFDQIVVSETLLGRDRSSLKYWKAEIFNRDFLIEKTGRNKGYPHRTFRNNTFIDGYSDHFPTLIYLVKEVD